MDAVVRKEGLDRVPSLAPYGKGVWIGFPPSLPMEWGLDRVSSLAPYRKEVWIGFLPSLLTERDWIGFLPSLLTERGTG